jgi:hypothetical protein
MDQLDYHLMDFNVIWYLSTFRNSVDKIQVSLKSDKITGTLNDQQYTLLFVSHSILLGTRNVSHKSCRANQNTYFMSNNFFRRCAFYEIMWKNNVDQGRPQMTYRACALHAGYLGYTHTRLRICNTERFSTATMVTRTRLNVTLYIHRLV